MAVPTLTPVAKEGSTYTIKVQFTDQDGDAATPKSATWTLKDSDGNVVNGRSGVSISALDATVYITISGNDLTANGKKMEELTITINAVYDSITYGNDLPLVTQSHISVEAA